jgi:prophage DNA circulation protein
MEPTYRSSLLRAFSALSLSFAAFSASAQQPAALSARDAGARYGQALGVALVCYGLRTRPEALASLAATYSDASGREDFQAEADKVLKSWQEASSCQRAGGPNTCRLIHEWSCRDALLEIGPSGTKAPGLVESAIPQ